jgi:prophage regulatory protein
MVSPRTILRRGAVIARTGYSYASLWRLERAGQFPSRVRLGPAAVGWYEDEVDEWVRSRVRGGGRSVPRRSAADAA